MLGIAGQFASALVSGAKSLLGIDDDPPKSREHSGSRSGSSASRTTFERESSASGTSDSSSRYRSASVASSPVTTTPVGDLNQRPAASEFIGDYGYGSQSRRSAPAGLPNEELPDASGYASSLSTSNTGINTQRVSSEGQAMVRLFDASRPDAQGGAGFIAEESAASGKTMSSLSGSQATAVAHTKQGLGWLNRTFGRDGLDGRGGSVDVVINDVSSVREDGKPMFEGNGGFYATPDANGDLRGAVRWGSGTTYDHAKGGRVVQTEMLNSDDLTIHEMMHGMIFEETGKLGGEADQAGATNEAVADVLAASATRDWTIGEGMFAPDSDYKSLRNIANPHDPTAVHDIYTSVKEVNDAKARGDHAEEHYQSGVISNAAYRMQKSLGGEQGWRAVETIFYDAVDQNRLGDFSFGAVAEGLRGAAADRWGTSSREYQVVDRELGVAGL